MVTREEILGESTPDLSQTENALMQRVAPAYKILAILLYGEAKFIHRIGQYEVVISPWQELCKFYKQNGSYLKLYITQLYNDGFLEDLIVGHNRVYVKLKQPLASLQVTKKDLPVSGRN